MRRRKSHGEESRRKLKRKWRRWRKSWRISGIWRLKTPAALAAAYLAMAAYVMALSEA